MSGYYADSQVGRVTAGQVDTIWYPRDPRRGTCGVILFPGQGNPKGWMDGAIAPSMVTLAASLARVGIPCITSEFGGNSWAIDLVMNTYIPSARSVLASAFPFMRTDQICTVGGSMGGAQGTRYAQLHPDQVAATVGLIPAYDPRAGYIYSNVGDAAMEAAWGFSGLANFPDALDLAPKVAARSDVPIFTGYSANDDAVPAASVVAYHEAAGGDPADIVNFGDVLHSIPASFDVSLVARFLVKHGA